MKEWKRSSRCRRSKTLRRPDLCAEQLGRKRLMVCTSESVSMAVSHFKTIPMSTIAPEFDDLAIRMLLSLVGLIRSWSDGAKYRIIIQAWPVLKRRVIFWAACPSWKIFAATQQSSKIQRKQQMNRNYQTLTVLLEKFNNLYTEITATEDIIKNCFSVGKDTARN